MTPPAPPADLNSVATERWTAVVRILEQRGVLPDTDLGQLRRCCWLWARWVDLAAWIDKAGTAHVVKGADGKAVGAANWPQVSTVIQIEAQLARLEERLGLATRAPEPPAKAASW